MAASRFVFVYITCPSTETAEKIANHIVQARLAACANIISGMKSIYRWKGRLQSEKEVVLILKARRAAFAKLERAVKKLHPYECPCIVALPFAAGQRNYLKWLAQETTK